MKENWVNQMRQRLAGHRMSPPAGLWEGIAGEMGISQAPVRPAASRRWWYWAAAAAVLALVGLFSLQPQPAQQQSQALPQPQPHLQSQPQPQSESHPGLQQPSQPQLAELVARRPASSGIAVSKPMSAAIPPEPVVLPAEADEPPVADTVATTQAEPVPAVQTAKADLPHESFFDDPRPEPYLVSTPPSRRLSIGVNVSGGLLAAQTSSRSDRMYIVPDYQNDLYNGIPSYQLTNFVSEHHLPVRFGLSLRYELGSRLSLQTGLSYTSLYSRFSVPLYKEATFSQRLHYIGLPLGLSCRLYATGRFRLYASGSVVVEKCLRLSSDLLQEGEGYEKPWQWSLSVAAGAEYAVTRLFDLYLEPSLGYYFDDGTSLDHYYKSHPLAPTIEFGLRLNLRSK